MQVSAQPRRPEIVLERPKWWRAEPIVEYWGRDPKSEQEHVTAERIRWAVNGPEGPVGVEVEFGFDGVRANMDRSAANPALVESWLRRTVLGMLGWHLDPTAFENQLSGSEHERLIKDQRGLTIPQTPSLFAGLVWVICGQQISLPVAFSLRRKLAAQLGEPVGDLFAAPTAERLAQVELDELRVLGFSQRKAEYLRVAAEWIVAKRESQQVQESQQVPGTWSDSWFDSLAEAEIEAQLLAIRGLGPWSVNYLLMRSLGFADRVPLGDVALERALKDYFDLPERPKRKGTEELMRAFAPHRSLATFHLWKSLQKNP